LSPLELCILDTLLGGWCKNVGITKPQNQFVVSNYLFSAHTRNNAKWEGSQLGNNSRVKEFLVLPFLGYEWPRNGFMGKRVSRHRIRNNSLFFSTVRNGSMMLNVAKVLRPALASPRRTTDGEDFSTIYFYNIRMNSWQCFERKLMMNKMRRWEYCWCVLFDSICSTLKRFLRNYNSEFINRNKDTTMEGDLKVNVRGGNPFTTPRRRREILTEIVKFSTAIWNDGRFGAQELTIVEYPSRDLVI